jgi:predicted transcriptional regulator
MARRPTHRPTDAQLALLNVLWRIGPATVRQVHEALPEETRRGYTTTLKLMQIMAEKGMVRRDESRRSHVYSATCGEREMKDRLVGDLMEKAFEGSAAQLALRALAHKPASRAELEEVRRLIDELERSRGKRS